MLVTLPPIHLPATLALKVTQIWAPVSHLAVLGEAPGFWLWAGPALAAEAIHGVNQ